MNAQVQIVALECGQFLQEVGKRGELSAFDEVLLQVEEGPFNLPLRSGAIRLARRWSNSIVAAQLQELRVPPELTWLGVQHERFGVIDQELLGGAAEMAQALLDGFIDRGL